MTAVTLTLKGDEAISKKLRELAERCPRAAAVALYEVGTVLMRDSVRRTPSLTGELKRSAYVTVPSATSRPSCEIGYGSDHAVPVHEETEVSHDDGEAKFLQRALDGGRAGAMKVFTTRFMTAEAEKSPQFGRSEFPPSPHTSSRTLHPGKRAGELRDRIRRSHK